MTDDRRTYGDSCGIARALDLVGERWALLVARELVLGPKRFTDLRVGLPGVSADVLSQRLRALEAADIVRRRTLPPPAAARVYELTEWGHGLKPVLESLGRFGSQAPLPATPPPLSPDAAVVALQTMFDPDAAPRTGATYELRLDDRPFALRVGEGELEARQGEADQPVATIATDPATLAAVLWHGRTLAEAIAARTLTVAGDERAAEGLLGSVRPATAHA